MRSLRAPPWRCLLWADNGRASRSICELGSGSVPDPKALQRWWFCCLWWLHHAGDGKGNREGPRGEDVDRSVFANLGVDISFYVLGVETLGGGCVGIVDSSPGGLRGPR